MGWRANQSKGITPEGVGIGRQPAAPGSALPAGAGDHPSSCIRPLGPVSLLRLTSPTPFPLDFSLSYLPTMAPIPLEATSSQPVLSLSTSFWHRPDHPCLQFLTLLMPSARKQNPQKGQEDHVSRESPLPALCPSPVVSISSSSRKKGTWKPRVMVVVNWWGGGRADSSRRRE